MQIDEFKISYIIFHIFSYINDFLVIMNEKESEKRWITSLDNLECMAERFVLIFCIISIIFLRFSYLFTANGIMKKNVVFDLGHQIVVGVAHNVLKNFRIWYHQQLGAYYDLWLLYWYNMQPNNRLRREVSEITGQWISFSVIVFAQ